MSMLCTRTHTDNWLCTSCGVVQLKLTSLCHSTCMSHVDASFSRVPHFQPWTECRTCFLMDLPSANAY